MKIKADFVTNSSTASYIVSISAKVVDKDIMISIGNLRDLCMIDLVGMIEARLRLENVGDCEIILNEEVDDLPADGWGGDYYFAGNGGSFYGDEGLAKEILTKKDVILEFKDGMLRGYPESWKYEGLIWLENLVEQKGFEEVSELFGIDIDRLKLFQNNSDDDN